MGDGDIFPGGESQVMYLARGGVQRGVEGPRLFAGVFLLRTVGVERVWNVEQRLVEGDPAKALLEVTATNRANVIVVGDRGLDQPPASRSAPCPATSRRTRSVTLSLRLWTAPRRPDRARPILRRTVPDRVGARDLQAPAAAAGTRPANTAPVALSRGRSRSSEPRRPNLAVKNPLLPGPYSTAGAEGASPEFRSRL